MILYKYRTDSERTEEILKNKKVWFASPDTLNDPLECSIQKIARKGIDEICEQEKKEQLASFLSTYFKTGENQLMLGLPKRRIMTVLKRIGNARLIDNKYKIFSEFIHSRTGQYPPDPTLKYVFITSIIRNVGVLSLSETCDNELMWGHYSDGGKGVVIGFEIQDDSSITPNSLLLKVNYSDEPLVLKNRVKPTVAFTVDENGNPSFFQAAAFDDPFLKTVMSTKNTSWAYEKEWRCVEQALGLRNIISPICEVVFGIKCPDSVKKKYITIAKEHCGESVRFFEIALQGRKLEKQPMMVK